MKRIAVLLLPLVLFTLIQACSAPDKPTIGLYLAIKRGDIDQIDRHIYWGTDINQINIDGDTPLHESARAGRIIVSKLLLKNGAEVDKKNRQGKTPLFVALQFGRTQLADLLIKSFQATFEANTILIELVQAGVDDRDVVRFLVRNGAEINSTDDQGDTALIIAVKNQNRVLSKHLIANGADVNMPGQGNQLPMDIAKQLNNQDLITLLHANGARASTNP